MAASAFLIPAVNTVLDYAKRKREARDMRRQAASDILASSARSLGAPTYAQQAAKVDQRASQLTQPDHLSMLQQYLNAQQQSDMAQGGAQQSQQQQQEPDPLQQVLLNPTYRR